MDSWGRAREVEKPKKLSRSERHRILFNETLATINRLAVAQERTRAVLGDTPIVLDLAAAMNLLVRLSRELSVDKRDHAVLK